MAEVLMELEADDLLRDAVVALLERSLEPPRLRW